MQSIAFAVVIFLIGLTLKQYTSRYSVKLDFVTGNMLEELTVLVLWSTAAVT